MARSLHAILTEMYSKYRDLSDGLAEARVAARGGASLATPKWESLGKKLEGLRNDLEGLDTSLGETIEALAVSKGIDPARAKLSDLLDIETSSEADEIRAAAASLREIAEKTAGEAETNARVFADRIGVIEATLKVLEEATRGPAYGPTGAPAAATGRGFFEGKA